MKWLNTYNNLLFAALGTLSIIVLAFVAISSLSLFSDNGGDNRGINQEPVTIEEGLAADNENIEFMLGDPELIDSSMSTYIIPVYKPEAHESSGKFSSSSYRSGLKINLIIHDFENNTVKKLFNHLVLINYYEIIRTRDKVFIEMVYSEDDTNKNDIIDFEDQKSIGLYDIGEETFNTIPLGNTYISISSIYDKRLNSLIIVGENILPNKQPTYQYYRYTLESQEIFELENSM